MTPSLVLVGGPVFTGDGVVQGVAVAGGLVVAAGSEASVRALAGPGTRVVDLRGRACLPGFHDAHTHLLGGALAEDALDLKDARSDEDLARAVATRLAEQTPGEWVLGRGWDADLFPGGRWPGRAALDRVAPDTPVLLRRRDGHAALANGEALRRAGVDARTPDPPGGRLLRDDRGEPAGILLEDPALELVSTKVPTPTFDAQLRAAARLAARCAALGITSVQDDPSFDEALDASGVYARLHQEGRLPLRVMLWRRLERDPAKLAADERRLRSTGVPAERVAFGQLKGYVDGSLGSRTALLFQPYCDEPGVGAGVPVLDPETLARRVVDAHRRGHQVGIHAIGDRAAAVALDALEAAAAATSVESVRARRHRLEHAQLVRPDDVARMRRLGAVASVQPIHLASDARIAGPRLGPERCGHAYPWRSLREATGLCFGTDYPVEPLDPLPNLACAVTRASPRDADAPPFVPDEAVSALEALAAYGAGSAWSCHREAWLGRLARGQAADLVVLSGDPLGLPPREWPSLGVELTVVGGEAVFDRLS